MKVTVDRTKVVVENDMQKVIVDAENIKGIRYIEDESSKIIRLGDLKHGSIFLIGNEQFCVLKNHINTTQVISDGFIKDSIQFGLCSDWKQSFIRKFLNEEYYNKISRLIGKDNILPIVRDLTSLDGLKDYGKCTDMVTLLTTKEYAKYHSLLGVGCKYLNAWWTITSWSTPTNNNYNSAVCFVDTHGAFQHTSCNCAKAVRPVLTLNNNLKVQQLVEN